MNIQSSLNSMIGTVGFSAGVSKYFLNTEKWFNENGKITKAPKSTKPKLTKEEEEYYKSGQAKADAQAANSFFQQYYQEKEMSPGEAKALQSVVKKTDTFHNQKEGYAQRKEYLRKPRVVNRHGVLYQEVMKDGK